MAMFSFDEQAALFDVTPLPNQFILNYLPEASGDAVRVYLFGLVACYHHEAISDLQQMARELNMTEDDIRAAYRYWERKGLVQRVADNPPQYRYQNIYQVMMTGAQAQIDPAYEQFAEAIYGVFDNDRRLHGKDVSQCYEWVEQMRLPPGRGDCHDAPHGAEARQEREHEKSRADGDAAGGRKGADGGGGAGDFPARSDRLERQQEGAGEAGPAPLPDRAGTDDVQQVAGGLAVHAGCNPARGG